MNCLGIYQNESFKISFQLFSWLSWLALLRRQFQGDKLWQSENYCDPSGEKEHLRGQRQSRQKDSRLGVVCGHCERTPTDAAKIKSMTVDKDDEFVAQLLL